MSGMASDFDGKASEVGKMIQNFKTNIKSMKRMLNYIDNNKTALRQQWSKLKETTSKIARNISVNLKSLQQLQPSNDSEANKRREYLQDEFKTLLDEYEKMLGEAESKEKLNIKSTKESIYQSKTGRSRKFSKQEKKEQEMELQILKQRQENLENLATDIKDLDIIFKQLGEMVDDQRETIDHIDTKVEHAAAEVNEGTDQIKMARISYLKSRKKQALIGALALVIVVILVAYFVHKFYDTAVGDGDEDDTPNRGRLDDTSEVQPPPQQDNPSNEN